MPIKVDIYGVIEAEADGEVLIVYGGDLTETWLPKSEIEIQRLNTLEHEGMVRVRIPEELALKEGVA